jgi:ABC-type antimicrobial peptide transport system permease subunit
MTPTRLAFRNLVYHWRGNVAVFLGVVVGTAVLTGALLVRDSLRGSLRRLTLERLGWVDRALVGPRFFREETVRDLPAGHVAPALVLRATASTGERGRTVRQVNVLGVDERFWPGTAPGNGFLSGAKPRALINATLAGDLGAGPNVSVELHFARPGEVPREALLGQTDADAVVDRITVEVADILADGEFGGCFSLQPLSEAPRSVFLPLRFLQAAVRDPAARPLAIKQAPRINAAFVGEPGADLADRFQKGLTLDDWGLTLLSPRTRTGDLFARLDRNGDGVLSPKEWTDRGKYRVAGVMGRIFGTVNDPPPERDRIETYYREHRPYLSLQSRRLLLDSVFVQPAEAAARECGLSAEPTLVYLVNKISDGTNEVPYSVVAAVEHVPGHPEIKLGDDEILLVDWKARPALKSAPGSRISLTFFRAAGNGRYELKTASFTSVGSVPLSGSVADPDLTPDFPGLTDAVDTAGWQPPYPFQRSDIEKHIKHGDSNALFWEEYRATPKAYISLKAGQSDKVWGTRFGSLTSIRLYGRRGTDLEKSADCFREQFLRRVKAKDGGLIFEPVKDDALKASHGGGFDFAALFLGFSFFLIAAALLLVGLLFRLNLDRRASEVGLLLASGYRRGAVRQLLVTEGAVLAVLGAAVGSGAAMGYSAALVRWLGVVWPGGTLRSLLRPDFTWTSLAIGFAASASVSLLTILWAVRGLGKASPRVLLAGNTTDETYGTKRADSPWGRRVAGGATLGAVALLAAGPFVKAAQEKAGTFFGAGALLLTAALAALAAWMGRGRHAIVTGGALAVERLGVRNAARDPTRSLLTSGLLASAAFLIVAVEAFRRTAGGDEGGIHGPSGGFALLAESDLPVFQDLNGDRAREEMRSKLAPYYRDQLHGDNEAAERRAAGALDLLGESKVFSFRLRSGDDASCLNLYQPKRPRIFGVPAAVVKRGGFAFSREPPGKPWETLERKGEPFAAFGEKNTVEWMLKPDRNNELTVPDEKGIGRRLRIDGLLHDSVFQSGLLVSEDNFLQLYPAHEGYNFFLIEVPPGKEAEVKSVLEIALADRGFEVTPTAQRLASYLAVENTYLSTFQALGGLGLLLGSLGLAVVLLRGVWERRAELALLRALGYRRGTLGRLVLAENGFLLLVGLVAGTASALLAVAPHLVGGAGGIPWLDLAALLGLVLVVGLLAGAVAVAATLRAPLIPALRRE